MAEGLKIERIAANLQHPRRLLTLPNGDVLVVEGNGPGEEPVTTPKQWIAGKVKARSGKAGKGGNRVTLLHRSPGTNTWTQHVYIEGLHSPFGIQLIGDTLYVANTGNIMQYHYVPGETRMSDKGREFTDLPSTINHHWTKELLASRDGRKLYVGVGSNSNITENGLAVEYRRAVVLEVDVATRGSRIFASGIRNPTGLDWEPSTGQLWAVANERDEIGADLVPDYLTSVKEDGFYGWPYSYYGQHVDERVQPQRPDLVAKAIVPDYAIGSHVAPLGLLFYTGQALPPQYHGGAFIGEHGSWDRSPLSGYEVVYVSFRTASRPGGRRPWSAALHRRTKTLMGAPVGMAMDAEGALLVADDVGDVVWRVSAKWFCRAEPCSAYARSAGFRVQVEEQPSVGSALQFRGTAAEPAEHRFRSKPHAAQQHAEIHHCGHHEAVTGRHRRTIALDEANRKRHQRQRRQRVAEGNRSGRRHQRKVANTSIRLFRRIIFFERTITASRIGRDSRSMRCTHFSARLRLAFSLSVAISRRASFCGTHSGRLRTSSGRSAGSRRQTPYSARESTPE